MVNFGDTGDSKSKMIVLTTLDASVEVFNWPHSDALVTFLIFSAYYSATVLAFADHGVHLQKYKLFT